MYSRTATILPSRTVKTPIDDGAADDRRAAALVAEVPREVAGPRAVASRAAANAGSGGSAALQGASHAAVAALRWSESACSTQVGVVPGIVSVSRSTMMRCTDTGSVRHALRKPATWAAKAS